jgi:hypothetical protein
MPKSIELLLITLLSKDVLSARNDETMAIIATPDRFEPASIRKSKFGVINGHFTVRTVGGKSSEQQNGREINGVF